MNDESIKYRVNSIFNSVSYRVGKAITDPGDEWEGFYDVELVLLTHVHFDHIYGLNRVMELNPNATVITNEAGVGMLSDPKKNLSKFHETPFVFKFPERVKTVEDGDKIMMTDGTQYEVMETPGHNASCICYVNDLYIITGDSYIPGINTVTNLPGGNKIKANESEKKILELAAGKIILPGHKVVNEIV